MHKTIEHMLQNYVLLSSADYINALKEIIQEIALLGLWRSKFFEQAAFYGGSALRILYKLDRFSEDLDFSLLAPDQNFKLEKYNASVIQELTSFGFEVTVESKEKQLCTATQSAFIKTGTRQQLLYINADQNSIKNIPHGQLIQVKMEIDTNPPPLFNTEAKFLLQPIPFAVNSYQLPDLFAGKISALFLRQWKLRVKGRDWYDFVWFIGNNVPVNLEHLEVRLRQGKYWLKQQKLNKQDVLDLLLNTIEKVDFHKAKEDVLPFLKDQDSVAVWSIKFFSEILPKIKFTPVLEPF